MWNNKQVRAHARKALRKNYWPIVGATFLLCFIGVLSNEGTQQLFSNSESPLSLMSLHDNEGLIPYLKALLLGEDYASIASATINGLQGTGGAIFGIMHYVDDLVFGNITLARVLAVVGLLVYIAYLIFVRSALNVGFRRTMLETLTYSNTRLGRIMCVFYTPGYLNVCVVMFLRTLAFIVVGALGVLPAFITLELMDYQILEGTALNVMFVISSVCILVAIRLGFKAFFDLYFLPYILALNPNIKTKEAFLVSREMMKKNCWHLIKLELSFVLWILLSYTTFGLLGVFFVAPYRYLTRAAVFLKVRDNALERNLPYSYLLEDELLTHPAPSMLQVLKITPDMKLEDGTVIYPLRYPEVTRFGENRLSKYAVSCDAKRSYSILNLVLLFFIFAVIGWVWEVALYVVRDGVFVNRGSFHGPWLPIYGFGGIFILVFLRRYADKPHILFPATMVLCSALEYFASFFMELLTGERWWDYSECFLNLNGRICLEGALLFAIGGLIFVYLAGPFFDNLLNRISERTRKIIAAVLAVIFVGDAVWSFFNPNAGEGITSVSVNTDDGV